MSGRVTAWLGRWEPRSWSALTSVERAEIEAHRSDVQHASSAHTIHRTAHTRIQLEQAQARLRECVARIHGMPEDVQPRGARL